MGNSYPYQLSVQTFDFGSAAPLPTLHSFAAAEYDGKWIMLTGRTNGLHGFVNGGPNFPPEYANNEVWIVDPTTKQSWHRSLADASAGITAQTLSELSSTNAQSEQVGNHLYIAGGYGADPAGTFQTFNELASIDLPGISSWVINGTGSAADSIRTVHDDTFKVTGGAMYQVNGRMHLVFGQDFNGNYNPASSGAYTQQVRSFQIDDDGTSLGVSNLTLTTPSDAYRRRDLNVFPTLKHQPDGSLAHGLEALAGVFTPTNGAWTVPVSIDSNGQTSMPDPAAPDTFKQSMNVYESAKLGLYSAHDDAMHEVLFGGITLKYYDPASNSLVQDDRLPFTSQITQVNTGSDGSQSQDYIGEFPDLRDGSGNRMLFGTNAQFFLADGVPTYDNGVINLDDLPAGQPVVLGYIFGGIFSNAPNTRGVPGALSGASNQVFEVVYTSVPEPASLMLGGVAFGFLIGLRRPRLLAA